MDRGEPAHGKAPPGRLWDKLSKTRRRLADRLNTVTTGKKVIDPSLLEDLEEILLTSDIGVETTGQLIEGLQERVDQKSLDRPEQVKTILKEEMISFLEASQDLSAFSLTEKSPGTLHAIMFVGVNGVGKTTAIAKMAHHYQSQGQKVMLVAADTFRAAATEQLKIWGDRVGAEVISQKRGADPAAVVFDALSAAKARRIDKILIDTAGRLHTKSNLMEELKKIQRVAGKQLSGAPYQVTLVLDATTGQNAIAQAHVFAQSLGVTDIILTKLDGTAKGGVVIGISRKLHIPISFLCTGEGLEDFEIFDPREFVEAIFA
ncbi:MAG: signal recognition particle-docking protein FtsY [Desulfobacterales bacterium]|nr:signal recognition particle-docking protein FtsY [Desulfobacterales bacterium]